MRSFVSYGLLAASVICSLSAATSEGNATTSNSTRALASSAEELHDVMAQVCGLAITGHDVGITKTGNPDNCSISCYMRFRQDTNAFTWTKYQGGTCFCKKVPNERLMYKYLVTEDGAVSVVNTRAIEGKAEIVIWAWSNTDLPGSDIGNVPARDTAACSEECVQWDRCFAHTWTKHNGGTCWLKSKVGPRVPKANAVSGYVAREYIKNSCRP